MQSQDEGLGYPTERGKDKYASRMTNGNRADTAFRLSICACSALIDKGMRAGNIKQCHRMTIGNRMDTDFVPSACVRRTRADGGVGWGLPHRRDKPLRYVIKPRRGLSLIPQP